MTVTVAAVDVGASSGRVIACRVGPGRLDLTEVHRFPNNPVFSDGVLRWDFPALLDGVRAGLRAAGPDLDSIGIDTWAVDYALLSSAGDLLANPVHYRDSRTDGVMDRVRSAIPDLYELTGIQFLPFNTLYQLAAQPLPADAAHALLIPDLLAWSLTGVARTEITNASTTQLLCGRAFSPKLLAAAGARQGLFPPLIEPGERIGVTATGVPVTAVGSHDTASAVVGVPAAGDRFAYLSSGTWSLIGLELDAPVLTDPTFTNELGVDGTVRYLRNVMGLWLLQECVRIWSLPLPGLLAAAAHEPPRRWLIDVDDPAFLPPGDMPARIATACDGSAPQTPPQVVRCIMDSLALAYRRWLRRACELAGRDVDVLHVVGGGARNELLCQLTADACGVPVVAGPVEATALGNGLVQARALGAVTGALPQLRALLRDTCPVRRYDPAPDQQAWRAAEQRLEGRRCASHSS